MIDHQALKTIYGARSKTSACIESWVLRLQPYNCKVRFVSSRGNIADALSRLNNIPASNGYVEDEEHVREVTLHAVPVALRIENIKEVSFADEELAIVGMSLKTVNWSEAPKAYSLVRDELTHSGQVVLSGTRIVVP